MMPFFSGISYVAALDVVLNKSKALKNMLGSMDTLSSKVESAERKFLSIREDLAKLDQKVLIEMEAYNKSITEDD